MTSPIDPVRRTTPTGRARAVVVVRNRNRAHVEDDAPDVEGATPPPQDPSVEAAFKAHMMGQERRRGARAGADVPEAANSAYTRTEWSGAADRRAKLGQLTRTKI
jgi:hypothetical protein